MEIKNRFTGTTIKTVEGANLCGANLYRDNLYRADLRGANLRGANLCGAIGNMREVFSLQLSTWRITFTKDTLCIGCEQYSIEAWKSFSDEKISEMSVSALDFWKTWKDFIFLAIEKSIGDQK